MGFPAKALYVFEVVVLIKDVLSHPCRPVCCYRDINLIRENQMKLWVTPRGDGSLTCNPVWFEHVTQRENRSCIIRFRVSKNYDEHKTTKTRLRSKSSHYDKR